VLKRKSLPHTGKVTGDWRLHNEELHKLCSSPNIIMVIKSKELEGRNM
jgi:hypothetical protein